ncbi:MAG: hypothetical protein ACTSRP_20000 [Candidatus Helarchaeota archaeon]
MGLIASLLFLIIALVFLWILKADFLFIVFGMAFFFYFILNIIIANPYGIIREIIDIIVSNPLSLIILLIPLLLFIIKISYNYLEKRKT